VNLRAIAQARSNRCSPDSGISRHNYRRFPALMTTLHSEGVARSSRLCHSREWLNGEAGLTEFGKTAAKGCAMDEPDIDDRLDLNIGSEWSEMDANSVRLKKPIGNRALPVPVAARRAREDRRA
jgi:hypothetical protein